MKWRFHPLENKKMAWPLITLIFAFSLFYKGHMQKQELLSLESLLAANRIVLSFEGNTAELNEPEDFITTFGIPANITKGLKGAKFGDGSTFELIYYKDDKALGNFLFIPIVNAKDENIGDTIGGLHYVARWGKQYYKFGKYEQEVQEYLEVALKEIGVIK
ncbi:MAG: hypothetical protein GXZ11_07080 [Tissierellia bacterium]|nr:hypothetical protein [Tissierellia bacterium]